MLLADVKIVCLLKKEVIQCSPYTFEFNILSVYSASLLSFYEIICFSFATFLCMRETQNFFIEQGTYPSTIQNSFTYLDKVTSHLFKNINFTSHNIFMLFTETV